MLPALLHAQTHRGRIVGLRRRRVVVVEDSLSILLCLLRRDEGHAEDSRLHIETLGDFGAAALHSHDGDLAHLVGATCNLNRVQTPQHPGRVFTA